MKFSNKNKNFGFGLFIVGGSVLLTDGLSEWFKITFGADYSISILVGAILFGIGLMYS
jgi:hypothetical protein